MTYPKTSKDNQPEEGTKDGAENGMDVQKGAAATPATPAKAKAKAKTKTKAKSGAKVTVIGPKQGRYRIGRKFGAEPVAIPLDDLGKDELKALQDDPALSVSTN